jgi:signal transduction histidine kinase
VRTLDAAVEQITVAIADLRELANGVRPASLDNGLDVALRELLVSARSSAACSSVSTTPGSSNPQESNAGRITGH